MSESQAITDITLFVQSLPGQMLIGVASSFVYDWLKSHKLRIPDSSEIIISEPALQSSVSVAFACFLDSATDSAYKEGEPKSVRFTEALVAFLGYDTVLSDLVEIAATGRSLEIEHFRQHFIQSPAARIANPEVLHFERSLLAWNQVLTTTLSAEAASGGEPFPYWLVKNVESIRENSEQTREILVPMAYQLKEMHEWMGKERAGPVRRKDTDKESEAKLEADTNVVPIPEKSPGVQPDIKVIPNPYPKARADIAAARAWQGVASRWKYQLRIGILVLLIAGLAWAYQDLILAPFRVNTKPPQATLSANLATETDNNPANPAGFAPPTQSAEPATAQGQAVGEVPDATAASSSGSSESAGAELIASATTVPALQQGITGVERISVGEHHGCLVTDAGAAQCWGKNEHGQLGNGTLIDSDELEQVEGLETGVASIAVGSNYSCALTVYGGVKCWGDGDNSILGGRPSQATPVDIPGAESGVILLRAGESHACLITEAGGARCWGDNSAGALGDGTKQAHWSLTDVSGLESGVDDLSIGSLHTCAVGISGTVKCWGSNSYRELGDGTQTDRMRPVDVRNVGSIDTVALGDYHSCALATSGSVWCWGYYNMAETSSGFGQGEGVATGITGLPALAQAIRAGGPSTCALLRDQTLWCWGDGVASQRPILRAGVGEAIKDFAVGSNSVCIMSRHYTVQCSGGEFDGWSATI